MTRSTGICHTLAYFILNRYINGGNNTWLILDSINTIDVYSYDGQGSYGFDSLTLSEGDLIRFSTYLEGESDDDFVYDNPSTWQLGEVLSIEKIDEKIENINKNLAFLRDLL